MYLDPVNQSRLYYELLYKKNYSVKDDAESISESLSPVEVKNYKATTSKHKGEAKNSKK